MNNVIRIPFFKCVKIFNKSVKIIFALSLVLILNSCFNDKPSDDEIRKLIVGDESFTSKYFKVSDIERLNGYKKGDNLYVVEVSYTVKHLVNQEVFEKAKARYLVKEMKKQGYSEYMIKLALFNQVFSVPFVNTLSGIKKYKAGEIINKKESYTFIKSEKGWVEFAE